MIATTGGAVDAAGGRAAGRRRALLIGVRETPYLSRDPLLSERYRPLDCVDRDVQLVGAALAGSGYSVDALHPAHPLDERSDPTRNSIVQAMDEFLRSCAPGDTAFVYLSCHGVSVNGRDYLLPADAKPRADGSLLTRTLIETTPDDLLDEVPAGVRVVVCLDTCRTDVPGPAPQRERTVLVGEGFDDVIWLRSSGRGQPAYADPEKGSYFGLALSEALSPNHPPQTFGEVVAFVRARVDRLTAHLTEPPPTVEVQVPKGREDEAAASWLCRGSQETLRWTEVVSGSVLWNHTAGDSAAHERVKDRLGELASEVSRSRIGTDSPLATPWNDPEYPIRVVRVLGRLVEQAALTGSERLSPAETAALLAAPLMHEGVVAVALSELAALRPDRLDRREGDRGRKATTPHDQWVCDAARDVCRAHSQVGLAAETLRQRRLSEAATAADHWLRHRFIADWDRLWDRTGDYGAVDHLLDMVVAAVAAGADGAPHVPTDQTRQRVDRQIRHVLPHMTVAPGSSPRINDTSDPRWTDDRAVRGNTWRGRDLAYLLWLSALLAADPRRMSSVLVDHLGAHRALVPADVVDAMADFDLDTVGRDGSPEPGEEYALAVDLPCPHPALHAAMEELAGTADASVRALHQSWKDDRRAAPDLLRGVPHQVTTEFLRPLDDRYTQPLERFRLAEDEIRPLLMGTQLYGDKMLAVRELYQNALDACRHRQLRVAYGRRRDRCPPTERAPEITFVQGYDAEDRPYIECLDTGTGMSRKKLTSMFARAGKRYEQDPDFVQERRNWRRAGIDPTPFNSRFGIGVFSYFMLAEEVVVTTSTVDLHGLPSRTEAPLQATIQSGSGLLQITPTTAAPERGGTLVRLYLSQDDEAPPSLVETLRSLLWVSDHKVTAVELDREGNEIDSEIWHPGKLRATEDWPADPVKAGTDGWIVQGRGQLLLDGVVVAHAPRVDGYVFNLRERHHPVPSVDRNSLLSYDEERVDEELFATLAEAVGGVGEVSLRWLWDLAEREPRLAVGLVDALPADAVGVLHAQRNEYSLASTRLPLRETGVLPLDGPVLRRTSTFNPTPGHGTFESALLRRWRRSVLGLVARTEKPPAADGYPAPEGLDALLFLKGLPDGTWVAPLRAAALAGIPLAETVRALRRYAIAGVDVPAVEDVRRLRDLPLPTMLTVDLCLAYQKAEDARTSKSGRPAAHAPLLAVAARHGIPPSQALADIQRLAHLGVPVPDFAGLRSAGLDMKVTTTEATLLAAALSPLYGGELGLSGDDWIWRDGEVHPVDLMMLVPVPQQRRKLYEQLKTLAPLGFTWSPGTAEETLDHRTLTGDEQRLLSMDTASGRPWLASGRLHMVQLLERSAGGDLPLGKVAETIDRLAPATGVSAPAVPPQCASWTAPSWVHTVIRTGPRGNTETEVGYGPWRLIRAAYQQDQRPTPDELWNDLTMLAACGVLSPSGVGHLDAAVAQFAALTPTLVDLLELAYPLWFLDMSRWDLDHGSPDFALLVELAAQRRTTLGEIVAGLLRSVVLLPLELPELPEQAHSLAPSVWEVTRLTNQSPSEPPGWRTRLSAPDLLAYAETLRAPLGDAIRRVSAFRCVGGPALPGPFTGPDAEVLEGFVPDFFDLAAFDPGLLGPGLLGPLELVLVAGRFGWSLGRVYDRYAPFRCLGLDVRTPAPDEAEREITPDWQDVVLLTRQLTGRAPALEGPVDPDHLALCAEETDSSEDEVLSRLRRYARLFALELPTPGGPRP
ncbi:caspase family protein [Streptomyces sp. NPDC008121]|uniref:HD domain-containing protein n=1 Tax=Streptomyces sp. NPDC008121 TaxID=3364809 RepID=UPI0036EC594E